MELFFRNPGMALVRERILKGVWGENYFGDVKIVDVNTVSYTHLFRQQGPEGPFRREARWFRGRPDASGTPPAEGWL